MDGLFLVCAIAMVSTLVCIAVDLYNMNSFYMFNRGMLDLSVAAVAVISNNVLYYMIDKENLAGTLIVFALNIAALIVCVANTVWYRIQNADMKKKFAFYEEYRDLGLDSSTSEEVEKQTEEIAKKYNIEYDNINDLITTVKCEYNRVQELKKRVDENSD